MMVWSISVQGPSSLWNDPSSSLVDSVESTVVSIKPNQTKSNQINSLVATIKRSLVGLSTKQQEDESKVDGNGGVVVWWWWCDVMWLEAGWWCNDRYVPFSALLFPAILLHFSHQLNTTQHNSTQLNTQPDDSHVAATALVMQQRRSRSTLDDEQQQQMSQGSRWLRRLGGGRYRPLVVVVGVMLLVALVLVVVISSRDSKAPPNMVYGRHSPISIHDRW
jgi:hypothetical protein